MMMRSDCTQCHGTGQVINLAWLTILHNEEPDEMTNEQLGIRIVWRHLDLNDPDAGWKTGRYERP